MISHTLDILKGQTHRNTEYSGGYQGLEDDKNVKIFVKEYKLPFITTSSGGLMYSMVIIAHNTLLYI